MVFGAFEELEEEMGVCMRFRACGLLIDGACVRFWAGGLLIDVVVGKWLNVLSCHVRALVSMADGSRWWWWLWVGKVSEFSLLGAADWSWWRLWW